MLIAILDDNSDNAAMSRTALLRQRMAIIVQIGLDRQSEQSTGRYWPVRADNISLSDIWYAARHRLTLFSKNDHRIQQGKVKLKAGYIKYGDYGHNSIKSISLLQEKKEGKYCFGFKHVRARWIDYHQISSAKLESNLGPAMDIDHCDSLKR